MLLLLPIVSSNFQSAVASQLHVSRASHVTMLVKEEAPVKDAKGRKTVRPKRDEEVLIVYLLCLFC